MKDMQPVEEKISQFQKVSDNGYFVVDFSSTSRITPSNIVNETKIISYPWNPTDIPTYIPTYTEPTTCYDD